MLIRSSILLFSASYDQLTRAAPAYFNYAFLRRFFYFFLYIWLISKIEYVIRTEIDGVQYLSIRDIVITMKKKRKHDGPDSPDPLRQLK